MGLEGSVSLRDDPTMVSTTGGGRKDSPQTSCGLEGLFGPAMYRGSSCSRFLCLVRDPPLRPEGRMARAPASVVGHGRCGYAQRDYSFMPANAALRCQSNKAARSSRAHDDGVIGADL